MNEQQNLDVFREMNHYDDRDADLRSTAVFEAPRRTLHNGWKKFHAARDCGEELYYLEQTNHKPAGDRFEYKLLCMSCGYEVPEEEVLFIGGDWYSQHGLMEYGRMIEDLRLPKDRILALGSSPSRDELVHALTFTRIEQEASYHGLSFGNERRDECEDCGNESTLLFDERCRMCYDGEWTGRMQSIVDGMCTAVRERNDSFAHRLEQEVDPLSPGDTAMPNTILWRRHEMEATTRLVEVTGRLEDQDDGHVEYVLWDPTMTTRWQYREEDLADCFWDTGLRNDEHTKAVQDDEIRAAWQRVCDHSFSDIHDSDTMDVIGESCIKCQKRREVDDGD